MFYLSYHLELETGLAAEGCHSRGIVTVPASPLGMGQVMQECGLGGQDATKLFGLEEVTVSR